MFVYGLHLFSFLSTQINTQKLVLIGDRLKEVKIAATSQLFTCCGRNASDCAGDRDRVGAGKRVCNGSPWQGCHLHSQFVDTTRGDIAAGRRRTRQKRPVGRDQALRDDATQRPSNFVSHPMLLQCKTCQASIKSHFIHF